MSSDVLRSADQRTQEERNIGTRELKPSLKSLAISNPSYMKSQWMTDHVAGAQLTDVLYPNPGMRRSLMASKTCLSCRYVTAARKAIKEMNDDDDDNKEHRADFASSAT